MSAESSSEAPPLLMLLVRCPKRFETLSYILKMDLEIKRSYLHSGQFCMLLLIDVFFFGGGGVIEE